VNACSLSSRDQEPGKGRFVFATDFHFENSWRIPEAGLKFAAAINNLAPDLVICGGDLISEGIHISQSDYLKRYRVFETFLTNLGAPTVLIPGNHDLSRDESGISFSQFTSLSSRKKTFSALNFLGFKLIFLDSVFPDNSPQGYRGEISKEQLLWLSRLANEADRTQPVIVFSHIPFLKEHSLGIFSDINKVPPTHFVSNWQEVLQVLSDFNIHSLIQGHTHLNEKLLASGIPSVTSGAVCGQWWCGDFLGSEEGFLVGDIAGKELRLNYKPVRIDVDKPC